VEFRILGPLEVEQDGRLLKLGGSKQRALLAFLLLHANQVMPRDRLIDELWGGEAPETARTALQVHVSQLRKALDREAIITQAPGYLIRVEAGALDLERFEELVAEARGADPATAAERLRAALALWRGVPLAEFDSVSFARTERARLEEQRLAVLEQRIEADLELGRHADLVRELEALVREHPLRERLRAQLMLALYRSGRQAEALEVYRSGRRLLDEELGLEPDDGLKRLEKAILTHDPSLEAPVAADAGSTSLALSIPAKTQATVQRHRRSGRGDVPVPPDSVALIDPMRDRVVGHVLVGRRPVAVAVGHGSVWVANADDATISRIDLEIREVVRTIGIGAPAIDLAIAPDAVWVATGSDGTLVRIDPDAEAVVETIDLRGSSELVWNTTYAVDADAAAVWVATGPRSLVRIDPATNELAATIDVGHVPVSVACGAGAVWVATIAERALRIEPQTNAITAEASIGDPVAVAVGEEAVWVADARGRLWSIDPDTATVIQTITVGRGPVGLFAGDGAVWLANSADGTVLRVDPVSGQIVGVFTVGHAPTDVALGEGVFWVSVQSERVM